MEQTGYHCTYIIGEPIILYAVDIFPQYCILLVTEYSKGARGNSIGWDILTPYVVIYFSQYPFTRLVNIVGLTGKVPIFGIEIVSQVPPCSVNQS
jgi:hypothetical protein